MMITMLAALACGVGSELDAEALLTMDAISGEEEDFAKDGLSEPDAEERLPLFRECDPAGDFVGLHEGYDRNASGELEAGERDDCEQDHEGGPHGHERMVRWEMLLTIYDLDGDGDLSEAERGELFADFEERCEVLHEQLLSDFDADGDGELSDEELEAAHTAHEAEREERRSELEASRGNHDRPEPGELHPWQADYDADGDGDLSDAELETLRSEARERIRAGEPPFEPPA